MLTGTVIIITGASSGIGAATALEAARRGMDVVVTARREERLREIAGQVRALGRRCEIVAGDVIEPGMSQRLIDAAERAFGRFDAVFANAGYGLGKSVLDTTEGELRAMFEVNFFAGVDLLRRAAERLIAQQRPGHLLMCSSCLAKFTLARSGVYSATKAAQNHICRAMRLELRRHRIHVASVHPIGTETEFSDASAKRRGDEPRASNAPRMFMQSSERVARAVVRCLDHPRPEVWTSLTMRALSAVMTACPRLGDAIVRRGMGRE